MTIPYSDDSTAEVTVDGVGDGHRAAIRAVLDHGTLSMENLWLRAFSIGADLDLIDLEGYLHGLMSLPALQRDVLAHAANEYLDDEVGRSRVPYSRVLSHPLPAHGPLAALVHLINEAPRALFGKLAAVAAEAAGELGVGVVVYLVDYEQLHLVPMSDPERSPAAAPRPREPLDIESTLPGRAFQSGITQSAISDAQLRWWVPMVRGTERIGVLDVLLRDPRDLHDPYLRQQCEWLASMLGNLVLGAAEHGDGVDDVRRTQRRSPAAELMASLLPPLSAESERFTLAGLLEPCYSIGGDAFDYALGPERVQLAVFDGMGHELGAGLIAATALSVYRAGRRSGDDLPALGEALDEALEAQFPDAFATGILADLDLRTGSLEYLAGGHPAPLLLRDGKVVTALEGGRRLPFGLGDGTRTVGRASLEPEDWLVLYTDGVTEARAAGTGDLFGEERLIDFLEREAMAQHSPTETVRRLIHAVLDHQADVLQDDATVLLARWAPGVPAPPLVTL
ncbi:PP2C family protein-serine/threonine phosphatase [Nocardioides sp.]|uniref:PP2C family protein-serine/threonine phosphatase n=1 Tax=Nocardioides sp. TaxID=35761 RepID=UPI002CB7BB22|nr:PP2C family protein-serine/threonine phosphatase [Nocardioides sp.]HXH78455.1 PP2C family protein-serine/threonine phosphatase [Nocardioides sp.]